MKFYTIVHKGDPGVVWVPSQPEVGNGKGFVYIGIGGAPPYIGFRVLIRIEPVVDFQTRLRFWVDLEIIKGRTLALVGESGSGKTVTAMSILRPLPGSANRSKNLFISTRA